MSDAELLLRTFALLTVTYAFCRLAQLIYKIIQKIFYIVLYAVLYIFYNVLCVFNFDGEKEKCTSSSSSSHLRIRSGPNICTFQKGEATPLVEKVDRKSTITIAIDSTPERGGGLLILPKQKHIYFYSIKWPSHFRNELDEYKLLNANISLLVFGGYIASYRSKYSSSSDALVLKCDNNFCNNPESVFQGQKNLKWRKLFGKIDAKLQSDPFLGEWSYEEWNDECILMASKLSRSDCSKCEILPKISIGNPVNERENHPNFTAPFYPDYSSSNVTKKSRTKTGIYSVGFQVEKMELFEMFDVFSMAESDS